MNDTTARTSRIKVEMVKVKGFEMWHVLFRGQPVARSTRWSQAEAERLAAFYRSQMSILRETVRVV